MDGPHRDATVPEHARFCPACDGPVGRGRGGRRGRERGVCPWCRFPYDLTPALGPGDLAEGTRGRYRVREPLRAGSRGWLYLADPVTGPATEGAGSAAGPVVLTRLEGPEGPAAGELAVREPEVLIGLAVPGLVRARDVAVVEAPAEPETKRSGARPPGASRHLVLDHVPGRRFDTDRPLTPAAALDAALAATGPLAGLHARGLLHADVSPANLLAGPAGVTLMDLGSVRRREDRTSDVWATTGFLAPEIAPGAQGPSVASDVFGLGRTLAVLLWEFDHTRAYALRLPEPADAPLLAAVPSLARLLARATDPDPRARHADMAEFAADVRTARADLDASGHHGAQGPVLAGDRAGHVGGGAATP